MPSGSNNGGASNNGAGSSGLPAASTAGQVPVSSGAGTTYTAQTPTPTLTSGADAARPAASASIVGQLYYATDTDVLYECVSSTAWAATVTGYDRASFGPFSGSNYLITPSGAPAAPLGGTGETVAVCLYSPSDTSAASLLVQHGNNSSRGWQLEYGRNSSARGQMSCFWYGLNSGSPFVLTAADFTGSVGLHTLALTITGGNVRYSLDGAAVTAASISGTYVPPNAGDLLAIGASVVGGAPSTTAGVVGLKCWSSVLSDSDLAAISGANATGRIPDGSSGTVTLDIAAGRYLQGATSYRYVRGSAAYTVSVTGVVNVVPR